MERISRKGFGFCSISHKSFQTYRISNRSSSVFFVRSVVNSTEFGLKCLPPFFGLRGFGLLRESEEIKDRVGEAG